MICLVKLTCLGKTVERLFSSFKVLYSKSLVLMLVNIVKRKENSQPFVRLLRACRIGNGICMLTDDEPFEPLQILNKFRTQ